MVKMGKYVLFAVVLSGIAAGSCWAQTFSVSDWLASMGSPPPVAAKAVVSTGTATAARWYMVSLGAADIGAACASIAPYAIKGVGWLGVAASAYATYNAWVDAGCPGYTSACSGRGPNNRPQAAVDGTVAAPPDTLFWFDSSNKPPGTSTTQTIAYMFQNYTQSTTYGIGCNTCACPYGVTNTMPTGWDVNKWSCHINSDYTGAGCGGHNPTKSYMCWPKTGSGGMTTTEAARVIPIANVPTHGAEMTQAELMTALSAAITSGNDLANNFGTEGINLLSNLNQNLSQLDTDMKNQIATLKNALTNALSVSQKNDLVAAATNGGAYTDTGLSSSETTEAVRKGVDEAIQDQVANGGSITVPPASATPGTAPNDPTPSEKKSITTVLGAFWSGVQALNVSSWLLNQTPNISEGSSVLTLPLPSAYGSSISIDFSTYQSILDFLGMALLAVTGVRWTMYIFEKS